MVGVLRLSQLDCGGISPWLLSLASLKLFPTLSVELPLRTYGCAKPLQVAQLIEAYLPDRPVALISYENPAAGNVSSFSAPSGLTWWFLQGRSFEQLPGNDVTWMVLILVFCALIVVSASIAAARTLFVVAQTLLVRWKKAALHKLQQHNYTCHLNSRAWMLRAQISEFTMVKWSDDAEDFALPHRGLSAAAVLVLFECLEHAEWQVQKNAIMRLDSVGARDAARKTLIEEVLGLPESGPILPGLVLALTEQDKEILRLIGSILNEKMVCGSDPVRKVQKGCPAELTMQTVGLRSCAMALKHKNWEVQLSAAMVVLSSKAENTHAGVNPLTATELNDVISSLEPLASEVLENAQIDNFAPLLEAVENFVADDILNGGASECAPDYLDPLDLASLRVTKAAVQQSCIHGFLKALKQGYLRNGAHLLLGTFVENQIKHLTMVLKDREDESCINTAKLEDMFSTVESVISALVAFFGKDGVRASTRHAMESLWGSLESLDESMMSISGNIQSGMNGSESSDVSSVLASLGKLAAATQQFCIQGCITALKHHSWSTRQDAVILLGTFLKKQINSITTKLQGSENEVHINNAKLADVRSMFDFAISALCGALADDDPDVRGSARQAMESLCGSLESLDESMMSISGNIQSGMNGSESSDVSSVLASLGKLAAATQQFCIQGCITALKHHSWSTRQDAVILLGTFLKKQINSITTKLQGSENEVHINNAKLADMRSMFDFAISAFCGALADDDPDVRGSARQAMESLWGSLESLDESMMSISGNIQSGMNGSESFNRANAEPVSPSARIIASASAMRVSIVQAVMENCNTASKKSGYATGALGNFAAITLKSLRNITCMDEERLNADVALLESIIFAFVEVAKDKQRKQHVINSLSPCLDAIEELDTRVLKAPALTQHVSHGSLASPPVTWIRSMQNLVLTGCLQVCIEALNDPAEKTRSVLMGLLEKALVSLAIALQHPETKNLELLFSLLESTVFALAGAFGAKRRHVRPDVIKALCLCFDALENFDETRIMNAAVSQSASDGSMPTDSAVIPSPAAKKASMLQFCVKSSVTYLKDKDWTTRLEAAVLLGKSTAKTLSTVVQCAQSNVKLSDMLAACEAIVSELGVKQLNKRDGLVKAIGSAWTTFRILDEGMNPHLQCGSDCPESPDVSSALASLGSVVAAIHQCCIRSCVAALNHTSWEIRQEATGLLGRFMESQIKSLTTKLQDPEHVACINKVKQNDAPSNFHLAISALFEALGDEDPDVREDARKALESLWGALQNLDEGVLLNSANVQSNSDCLHLHDFFLSICFTRLAGSGDAAMLPSRLCCCFESQSTGHSTKCRHAHWSIHGESD